MLIVLDTVRAESLSLYGYARPTTPHLTALARSGVRFERAISTAPWTIPSHASIFTGRYPHELTADWDRPLDATHTTIAEGMRTRGYATGGFVANTIACSYESGLSRGFRHYEDYTVSPEEFLLSASLPRFLAHRDLLRRMIGGEDILARKDAAVINRDFLAWQSHQGAKPFFAFLNYFDAHEPYLPPAPYDTHFGPVTQRDPYRVTHRLRLAFRNDREKISTADNQAELNAYDGSIAYLDAQLGALFDELRRRGVLDKTIVIVTADHGEAFGEHGRYTHGDSLYLTPLHVPLIISFPGQLPAGTSVPRPISLRDIPATIADLAGLGGQVHFPGRSLARFWNGAAPAEQPILSEVNLAPILPRKFPPGSRAIMRSLIGERYHYIRNHDDGEELYDILKDPLEKKNLAGSEGARKTIECFRQSIGLDRSPANVD